MRIHPFAWIGICVVAGAAAGTVRADDADARGTARDRAALVELGRRLFFEPAASRTGRVACSSCHEPSHGFTDVAHPSQDEFGPMQRRAMPLTDLPDGPMHSDGEFADVHDLLQTRLLPFDRLPFLRRETALEAFGVGIDAYGNLSGPRPAFASVGQRVASDGLYAPAFRAAFGDAEATTERAIEAIGAYTRSLKSGESPFDRFLAGDDTALPTAAARGMLLFTGKAGCAKCHLVPPPGQSRAELRDGRFHDTGIAWRTAVRTDPRAPRDDADRGHGLRGDTAAERRKGKMKFKTPSLREVSRRGPFMHDGSLASLGEVVDYYDTGGATHPGLDPALRPLHLAPAEKDDLVAFLLALSSPDRAGLGEAPSWLGRTTTVRIVAPDGSPVAGVEVSVESAGDGFRGVAVPKAPIVRRTDARGRVTFPFPPTTHARLRVAGHGVAGGRLLPDVAGDAELCAVPVGSVALRVRAEDDRLPSSVHATPLAVVDALTRVTARREGDVVVFELVRALSDDEGLYVATRPKEPAGSRRRLLSGRGGSGSVAQAQADVDFEGGSVTSVDLRPVKGAQFSAPEMPSGGTRIEGAKEPDR